MISASCGAWRIASTSCRTARSSKPGSAQGVFENPQHPYTKHLIEAEPKGAPPVTNLSGPVVVETDNLKVWFPIKRGLLAADRRSRQSRRWAEHEAARRRDARRGRRIGFRQNHARACAAAADFVGRARSPTSATASTDLPTTKCGRCARKCRSSFKTLTVRCRRA